MEIRSEILTLGHISISKARRGLSNMKMLQSVMIVHFIHLSTVPMQLVVVLHKLNGRPLNLT